MNSPIRPSRPHRALLGACCLLTVAATLTACGGSSGSDTDGADTKDAKTARTDAGAFPVTITSKFGTARITKAPKRVVALGWSDQDALLALGVKPVAIVKTEDSFKNGVGPWAEKALGDSRPEVLNTTDGYSVEKIAALHPDLIVGVQSGLTGADYTKLSQIAPTVGYLKGRQAYGTPWEEQTDLIGKAVGRGKEAKAAVAQVKSGLRKDAKTYPQLQNKSFLYAFPQPANGRVVLYKDERTKVLQQVGLTLDPVVGKGAKMNSFANSLSTEHLDELTSDALIIWYNTPKDRTQLESSAAFKKLPAVRHHAYVPLDRTMSQATSAPSVLSIPWSMQKLLPPLAKSLG
ncbi:iron-siderophore ABC transporter substrate-binding protein [Streptomyces sp. SID10853]|uniref:iron-siderophore ABC transporter substrate-binding protein n=1 Tax=Streptomyces sp. SID10853 TaxID=2706028 RepID=UPI0013C1A7BE|nr:iron-siderophore ABC transporter substrate-binding protein [Streptomyces sp. SID10853]NDZ81485.1 iron-siderophore ABC transporter substrate-binding protein [Streptomyces sp. SID10853]